jgi:ABC-type multidrug transport system fused ATPase/permease subunit
MITMLARILVLLSPREKYFLLIQFSLLVVSALLDAVGIASILPFMAVVSNPSIIHTNKWLHEAYQALEFTSPRTFLMFLGLLVLSLLIVGNGLKAFHTWISLTYDNRLYYNLSCRLLASYMARPYEFFLKMNTAEMAKNVLSEAGAFIAGTVSPTMQIVSNLLLCTVVLTFVVTLDPMMALSITVILGGAYGGIYLLVRQRLGDMGKEQSRANFMKFRAAGEALSSIKDLKVLGRERVFLDKFTVHAALHARHNSTIGTISSIPKFALETIAFGGILGAVLYSMSAEEDIGKVVPVLSVYAFSGYRLMPAIQQLFANLSLIQVNLPALDMLHRDLGGSPQQSDPRLILPDNHAEAPLPFSKEINLRDITFRYTNTAEHTIAGVTLSITSNTSIGLVGPTGSGKTTIIDIILGLLDPISGSRVVDGVAITKENLANWQRNIGYVPQHIYLSDDSITNNIAFGVPEAEIDRNAVRRAATVANLIDFVERDLPDGFETRIGERGVRLSGGQRQRIGIARALYNNPPVLVMDEATSALDGITEQAVMEAIRALAGKKTIILIAHRLTTLKDCDAIYVMKSGRIAENGTFTELMKSSSWFQAAARKEEKE